MCKKCKTPPLQDTPEVARKKLLWKLAYAKESFNACKQIAEQFIADIKVDSHPYYYAFVSSACITYARAFTHADGVGQLPRRYFRFSDDALRATHHTLLRSRHELYAHNDANVAMHRMEIIGTYDSKTVSYSYRIHIPKLRGIIFPNILKLCEFQMARASEELAPMLTELWPPKTIVTILRAEHSNRTSFNLKW